METEAFLEEILERGWSEKRQKKFIKRYGQTIRWSILYHIRIRFGNQSLNAINDYLLSLQEGQRLHSKEEVIGEILDLAADTWQDVLNDVFKTKDNLIHKYRQYIAKMRNAEQGFISFPYFLSKSVYYKFLDNLSPGLSDKEILDRIVDLKRESGRRFYIDEFRSRYRDYVEGFLRSKYPELRQMNNIIDYFFERFIPQAYPAIRQDPGGPKVKRTVLDLLLEDFGRDDCQKGSGYIRQVYGSIAEMGMSPPDLDVDVEEGFEDRTRTEEVPLNDEINYYWDQLIRCLEPDPEKIEELIKAHPSEGNVLCWACASMKRRFKRKEQKENLVAFIAFYSSMHGASGEHSSEWGLEGLGPEDLTLEKVIGRNLRWREDICRRIWGKHIRKDRVMKQIKREIMNSDYGYLISE